MASSSLQRSDYVRRKLGWITARSFIDGIRDDPLDGANVVLSHALLVAPQYHASRTGSRSASYLKSRPDRVEHDLPRHLIAKRLSLVAGRQLNRALARVALLTVCKGGEPSVNAISA
jgi:hypothetical protein